METPRLVRKCKARIFEALQDAGLDTPARDQLYNEIKEKGKTGDKVFNLPLESVKQETHEEDVENVTIKQEEKSIDCADVLFSEDEISDDVDNDDDDKDPDFMMPSKVKQKKTTSPRGRKIKKEAPEDEDQPKKAKKTPKPRAPRKTKAKKESEESAELNVKQEGGSLEDTAEVPKTKGRKRKTAEPKPRAPKKLKLTKMPVSTGSGEYHDSVDWCIDEVLAYQMDIPLWIARNVIRLFEEDCTIPFIARYRKEMTGNMDAQKLRDVYDVFVTLKNVQAKAISIINTIIKEQKMTPDLLSALRNATTMTELEHLYAPFKSGSKRTLAERAKKLGLEEPAMAILLYQPINLNLLIKPQTKGLTNIAEVCTGIQHIIADVISKDKIILDAVIKSARNNQIYMEVSKSKSSNKETSQTEKNKAAGDDNTKTKTADKKNAAHNHHKTDNEHKFELYYNFRMPAIRVRPHQTLAINRGETLKLLSVKIVVPEFIQHNITSLCKSKWMNGFREDLHQQIVINSIDDAYKRLLEPLLSRHIRSELTKIAEKESIAVFATNLQQLLLTPPLRGKTVLGIDPGFRNGCKMAVTSPTGEILHTDVFYLPKPHDHNDFTCKKLTGILKNFKCETIAIGNGTACRETETFISSLIQENYFYPLDVVYCIVNECGASIYSVTEDAAKEMPNLDPNVRSAVSISRRLQDPLAEYVKIEPKHLGVGMYQHDMPENALKTALDSVVVECVSFVGVDLNSVSEVLLRKIAGLNATRAKNIIAWRAQNGCFHNREQLKLVKGIGPKSYEQCAGFIRIVHINIHDADKKNVEPEATTSKGRKKKTAVNNEINPLDMTCIHPESYEVALKILEAANGQMSEIGYPSLIFKILHLLRAKSVQTLAEEFGVGVPTMQLILDGLQKPYNYDMRSEFEKPLFRKGITSVNDLKIGTKLSGRVNNIVHFGAFVDIGVGRDGLIHKSKMPPHILKGRILKLGDKVEVNVISVDVEKSRIGLLLVELL